MMDDSGCLPRATQQPSFSRVTPELFAEQRASVKRLCPTYSNYFAAQLQSSTLSFTPPPAVLSVAYIICELISEASSGPTHGLLQLVALTAGSRNGFLNSPF